MLRVGGDGGKGGKSLVGRGQGILDSVCRDEGSEWIVGKER